MALPDNKQEPDGDDSFRWGTWEELLLAFAVNRHGAGAGAWLSIASELQKRSSDPNLALTAQNCRQKYLDLKRRYVSQNDDESVTTDKPNDDETGASATTLLEELRKLRVAELRREVQRYDLNIESLELKMKSMEEEKERGSRRERNRPDLERKSEENRSEGDVKLDEEPSSEPVAGADLLAADELEKDHMSVNESNSTDLGAEKTRTGEKEIEPVEAEATEAGRNRTGESSEEPAGLNSEPNLKPDREDSCNGSSNSIEKESGKAAIAERASESGESEAESKGGDEALKESSDVQSSASRSKKEEGIDKARRGNTSGDERDHEDQSRSVKDLSAQSQPLIDFLQVIRSHKLGSVFERRLRSQETPKYQKLVLQHVDLDTIEQRLKEGWYLGSSSKFFRDLLLLVNNALVFFSKNSSEARAAFEFRKLIAKEMSKCTKSESSSKKQISLQSLSLTKKEDREASHSLLLKPRISGSLIVCRKRSSIAAKAAGSSSGADSKKKEQTASPAEEKDAKLQPSQPSENAEEPKITKKRTRDRFSSVAANSKKNGKSQSNNGGNKNPVAESGKNQGKGGSSSLHSEPRGETKRKNQAIVDSKKRGAANFLNRMKQSSSSNNGALLDALKNTPLTSESTSSKGGSEQKKNENVRRSDKKEHQVATKRSSETRQAKEKGSPAKRNVGRPPKTGTASRPNLGKRGRERDETEASVSRQPKKRSKKL
ncbi:DNA-binding bromodomain-containing protein [Dorcoceras hygrometricum]|uniref:DNA-binding bromodomain-containing protein n=1 Tax=Dorcoceras hygrometricum TaxID=472368 RepID=A0A2Z7D8B2_9LAMI|nr:DNA-binding bromodomain-containing protein [Dorcoceras hygrometricum]